MPRYRLMLIELLTPFGIGVLVLSLAGLGARGFWLLELTTHFKFQYLIGGALLLPGVLLSRCRWLITIVCFGIGLNAIAVLPWYLPTGQPAATASPSSSITIALANVYYENESYDPLLAWVDRQQPDLMVVEEFSPDWEEALTSWDQLFPYQIKQPRQDAFGIALYSRIPFAQEHIHTFGALQIPWIEARLTLDGSPITLWAVHPYPPVGAEATHQRNALLKEVSQQIQGREGLAGFKIVAGDLNTSFWSPAYQDLVKRSSLKNTRQGFGIQPTWFTGNLFLGVPLDHILVSPDVNVHQFQAGPSIGSDHLPVKAIVSFPPT